MSATMEAAVSVVPSMVIVPVTAGVRPTAVVDPRPVSSSATRKPTNVPVESSKLNSPTLGSTAHPPATPLEAGAPAEDGTPLDDAAGAVTALSAAVVLTVVWTAPTAASRLTAAGASSRRNHQIPTAASATSTTAPSSTHFNHDRLRGGDDCVIVDVSFTLCSWNKVCRWVGEGPATNVASETSAPRIAMFPPLDAEANRVLLGGRANDVFGCLADLPIAVGQRGL